MADTAASRRSFIFLMMTIIQGVFIVRPKGLMAAKQTGRDLVEQLETEIFESSRPEKGMLISSGIIGDKATLYREVGEKKIPLCSMNNTGNMIWELCDGNHRLKDISRIIVERCQVTENSARRDILVFLSGLKKIGAITL